MRVQYSAPGKNQRDKKSNKQDSRLSQRLMAAVAIFLAVFGVKSWLPQASAPAIAMLQSTLSADTDLESVTRALGEAASGDRDFTAVFRSLFLPEEEGVTTFAPGDSAHLRWEFRFLGTDHSDQEFKEHYLPGEQGRESWLARPGTGGEDTEA